MRIFTIGYQISIITRIYIRSSILRIRRQLATRGSCDCDIN